ncbi:MAG: DUF4920 domain-containing protein [Pseudomonadales bacterium]|nr:DUF4920 domain-containing protein [Pseudomonadales bacterium]MBO6565921.1 DUF4920 domain-containing protein [Pseudomonadales bacterium]MBO6595296.1 DUF4920 domain-containing protein [Pseudomonadales bacterium]MBO6821145.1 DUF4920 domain-containing protein [Pseudomonadales bacterium]
MKSILLFLGMLLSFSVSAESQHGDSMPEAGPTITLAAAISGHQESSQKISGQITEVCQKKGCFMVLTDGQQFARVTFKDYAFFVPIDSSSKDAVVYGQLTSRILSPDQANHYEEDAGRKGRHLEPVTEYSIVASSVVIR